MGKEKINPSTKIVQNLLILQAVNREFMNDLNSLRNDEFYYCAEGSEKSLKSEVSKLRHKYNLSPAYQPFIEDLAELPNGANNATFEYNSKDLPEHLHPLCVKNPNDSEYLAVIAITPETKPEEIRQYWKQIKYFAAVYDKKLKEKTQKSYTRSKLRRDLEIYSLKLQGKSAKDIANIINRQSDNTVGYNDVNIIIKRLEDEAKAITKE